MSFLTVERLRVFYGDFEAVRNISFEIPQGEIFGFIGPNGAGKTTTIKVLATLLKPTRGKVTLGEVDLSHAPGVIRERIGYVPDSFGVYDDLTADEYMHFFAAAYRIPTSKRKSLIADLLTLTDLSDKASAPVQGLSRGMKQRLSLARALLHDPKLLLLDEPASGLDPRARIEFREFLKVLKEMGKTILISSHILHELAQLCTRIGIIEAGTMVAEGSLDDIFQQLGIDRIVHLQISNDSDELLEKVRRILGVKSVERLIDRISVRLDEQQLSIERLLIEIQGLGARIRMFQPEALDMETAFMKLTEGKTA